jgi:predicted site-specific integrase-resolvase
MPAAPSIKINAKIMEDEELMSETEAARRLNIPLARLRHWSREGKLASRQLDDGTVVFKSRDIEALRVAIKKDRPRCRS